MKQCTTCKEEKSVDQFRRDATQSDGRQPRCKKCASERTRSVYTERYGQKSNARVQQRMKQNRQAIADIKRRLGCTFCPESEPVCLEFHHTNSEEKDFTIAQALASNMTKLLAEIDKCICVCSNCHKKVHAGMIKT